MSTYLHHVSGFFVHQEEAENTLSRLVEQGLSPEFLRIFPPHSSASPLPQQEESNGVLNDVLVDGAVGGAIGTGVSVAIMATNVSLFVASPLVGTLTMLGWGASMGGLIGATVGAAKKKWWLSEIIQHAITNDQVVLVAETRTEQETEIAQKVIKDATGESKDISTVCM